MARIAVIGATGYLGGYALTRLLADGHTVRAIVRSPEKASLPKGVETVRGDVTAPDTLVAAFTDVDGVLLTLNGGSDPERRDTSRKTALRTLPPPLKRLGCGAWC